MRFSNPRHGVAARLLREEDRRLGAACRYHHSILTPRTGFVRATAGVCVGRSKRRPKRQLGREGAPLGQRGGAPLNLAGDEMALLIEMVVDLGMN